METCSRTSENLPKFPSQSPLPPLVTVVRQRPIVVTEGKCTSRDIWPRDLKVRDHTQRMRTGSTAGLHAGR